MKRLRLNPQIRKEKIVHVPSREPLLIINLSPPSHWQKKWPKVANCKKYPCQFHWQIGFLAMATAAGLGLIGVN